MDQGCAAKNPSGSRWVFSARRYWRTRNYGQQFKENGETGDESYTDFYPGYREKRIKPFEPIRCPKCKTELITKRDVNGILTYQILTSNGWKP